MGADERAEILEGVWREVAGFWGPVMSKPSNSFDALKRKKQDGVRETLGGAGKQETMCSGTYGELMLF